MYVCYAEILVVLSVTDACVYENGFLLPGRLLFVKVGEVIMM